MNQPVPEPGQTLSSRNLGATRQVYWPLSGSSVDNRMVLAVSTNSIAPAEALVKVTEYSTARVTSLQVKRSLPSAAINFCPADGLMS